MRIVDVVLSKSYTGFYFDDQKAIKAGNAKNDGFLFEGEPLTDGFKEIRVPGEAISVQLILENGQIAVGDCVAVQYSGAAGRDPLFLADDFIPFIEENIKPLLIGEDVTDFKNLAKKYDKLLVDGKRLHTAIRYGVTQALLHAAAITSGRTMAEVIRDIYNPSNKVFKPVAVFTQSGDNRYENADKMIVKQVGSLPHALINNVNEKLGKNGEILLKYIGWLKNRILEKRQNENYMPIFHIDVYGTIGVAFNQDIDKIVSYLAELEKASHPFKLRIEGPVDADTREETMEALRDITKQLDDKNINVEIVADEWCNTLEDIKYFADNKAGHIIQIKTPDLGGVNNTVEAALYCKEKDIGVYFGGSCNETNISSQVSTNIAVACEADVCLAKPGMDVDSGYMIVKNEIERVVAINKARK